MCVAASRKKPAVPKEKPTAPRKRPAAPREKPVPPSEKLAPPRKLVGQGGSGRPAVETPLSSAQASKAASPVRQAGPSSGRPGKAAPLLPAHLQEPNYRVSPRQHASTKSFLTGCEADGSVGELDDLAQVEVAQVEVAQVEVAQVEAAKVLPRSKTTVRKPPQIVPVRSGACTRRAAQAAAPVVEVTVEKKTRSKK